MRKIDDHAVVLGAGMAGLLAARVLSDDADLVLDATGRGGRAAAWLATIGYDQPAVEQLPIHLKYATRHLRLPPAALPGHKFVMIGAERGRPTGLVLFVEEQDRWILTVIGYDRHHPPADPDRFLAFVETFAPPDVFTAIRDAQPLDDIVAYRFPANLRRRHEVAEQFLRVAALQDPVTRLFRPSTALGVVLGNLRRSPRTRIDATTSVAVSGPRT